MAGKQKGARGTGANSGSRPAKASNWVGKDMNLTAAQRKAAVRVVGTKGGKTRTEAVTAKERAASRKAVDISTTKWNTVKDRKGKGRGGLLTGTDGQAVTGTVTLSNGKKATYVRGKRISVMAAAPAKPRTRTAPKGGGGGGNGGGNPPPPPKRKGDKSATSGTVTSALNTPKPSKKGGSVPQSVYDSQVPKAPKPTPQRPMSGGGRGAGTPTISVPLPKPKPSAPRKATQRPMSGGGRGAGTPTVSAPAQKPSAPKKRTATSPNKRGGERRSAEQIAQDRARAYIRSQKPWGTGA